MEDAIMVHKNEIVYCDKSDKNRPCHYRLNAENIKKITFDWMEYKRFFGLRKELEEVIVFDIEGEDLPSKIIIREHEEPNFRRYRGGIRTFVDDNKVPIEVKRIDI